MTRGTSWTADNYPKVRECLPKQYRAVFDKMAMEGRRVREVLDGSPLTPALRSWRLACDHAKVPFVPCHTLRLDYITAVLEARRGNG